MITATQILFGPVEYWGPDAQPWRWVPAIDRRFRVGRTLVIASGCNRYLPQADMGLPIIQVTPCPAFLRDAIQLLSPCLVDTGIDS